jgi:hypothetical protein
MLRELLYVYYSVSNRVADPHNFYADHDPTFHFNADPDPTFNIECGSRFQHITLMLNRIWIQLTKIMRIHADPDPQLCLKLYLEVKINYMRIWRVSRAWPSR